MRLIPILTTAVMLAATLSAAPVSAADPAPALTISNSMAPVYADRIIDLLRPSLEKSLKHPVKVEHAGDAALDKTAASAPDGNTVTVVALLPHEIAEATGKGATKLSSLTPVAKLTGPGSGTLVVPKGSPIKNWADFAAAARARPLSIASPGRSSAAGVPIAFMERALNVQFKDVVAENYQAILDAMAGKKADAAFVVTLTMQPGLLGGPPLHPIVTFGAKRGAILPDVPTFIEAIGPQSGPSRRQQSRSPRRSPSLDRRACSRQRSRNSSRILPRLPRPRSKADRSSPSGCRWKSAMPPCCARRWSATSR